MARLAPAGARWTGDLADKIVAALPWQAVTQLFAGPAAPERPDPERRDPERPDPSAPVDPAPVDPAPVDPEPVDPTAVGWPGSASALAAAIADAPTPLVAIVLGPDLPPGGWAADAVALFGGARIDAVVGAGAAAGEPQPPAFLRTRRTERRPYRPLGQPPRYAVVRRDRFIAVGGFGDRAAGLGPHGAVAELVERLLDDGGTVAGLDLDAFDTPSSRAGRARTEFAHARARGGLNWRRGSASTLRTDLLPLLARTVRGPGNAGRAYAALQLAALVSAVPSARRHRG